MLANSIGRGPGIEVPGTELESTSKLLWVLFALVLMGINVARPLASHGLHNSRLFRVVHDLTMNHR